MCHPLHVRLTYSDTITGSRLCFLIDDKINAWTLIGKHATAAAGKEHIVLKTLTCHIFQEPFFFMNIFLLLGTISLLAVTDGDDYFFSLLLQPRSRKNPFPPGTPYPFQQLEERSSVAEQTVTADDTSFITAPNTSSKATLDDLTEDETLDLLFRITQPAQ